MKTALVVAPIALIVGFMLAVALRSQSVTSDRSQARHSVAAAPHKPTESSQPDARNIKPDEALRVGSRSITWTDLFARVRDVESIRPDGPKIADEVNYLIGCALLENEAQRLGVVIKEMMLAREVYRQVQDLRRRLAEQYGGAMIWEDWLTQQGFNEQSLGEYLAKGCRIIMLKRILVNASETRTTQARLKDRMREFLDFADVDDARFKRWCEETKRTGRYSILVNPALIPK